MAKFPVIDIVKPDGTAVKAYDLSSAGCKLNEAQIVNGFPPIEFIWQRWLPRGKVIVFAGAGGAGKSSVLTGLAVSRALGLPHFLGIPITRGNTLFVTGEDTPVDYGRRIAAWFEHFTEGKPDDLAASRVAKAISFQNFIGSDFRFVQRASRDYFPDLNTAEGIARFVREAVPGTDLVVVETASRFGGDESNQAHAALINTCEAIALDSGACVVLVSHTGKTNARENVFDSYAGRGGSALSDNARGTIVFGGMPSDPKVQRQILGRVANPDERHHSILALPKSTFAPPQDPIVLRRLSVRDSLVLELGDPLAAIAADQLRQRKNSLLRFAVGEIAKVTGKAVTARIMRESRFLPLLGGLIGYREIGGAVEDALLDGALSYGVPQKGRPTLIQGPKIPPTFEVHEKTEFELVVPFGDGVDELLKN